MNYVSRHSTNKKTGLKTTLDNSLTQHTEGEKNLRVWSPISIHEHTQKVGGDIISTVFHIYYRLLHPHIENKLVVLVQYKCLDVCGLLCLAVPII